MGNDLNDHYNYEEERVKGKVPRPMNCFFIYRKEKSRILQEDLPGEDNHKISAIIGNMWKNEPDYIKEIYRKKADTEKRLHLTLYPDYKYEPKRLSKNKKNSRRNSTTKSLPKQDIDTTLNTANNSPGLHPRRYSLNDMSNFRLPPISNPNFIQDNNAPFNSIDLLPSSNERRNLKPIEPSIILHPFPKVIFRPFN